MKFKVITLFPKIIESLRDYSVIGRAIQESKIQVEAIDLREFGIGSRKTVDDTPYGGGPGMVLKPDVMNSAIKSVQKKDLIVIALTPKGKKFDQQMAAKLAREKELVLVCGHYEGFDQRTLEDVDMLISVGNFVVTGGEIPAMILIDAIGRLQSGVLGNEYSCVNESHSEAGVLEAPQYTKPNDYNGRKVPDVLISGNHKEIAKWRKRMAIDNTIEN